MKLAQLVKILLYSVLLFVVGCTNSASTGAIDSLFGGISNKPILSSVPTQTIQQLSELKVDVNNTKKSTPGDDQNMSYTCFWDKNVDGSVDSSQSCSSLPGVSNSFSAAEGVLKWTPSTDILGSYEVKIVGTNEFGDDERIFAVNVRLKFGGIESITQVQGDRMTLNWTPNLSSSGYQILKKGTDGTFSLFQSVTDSSIASVTLTGLTPMQTYAWRVIAVDSLGQQDGNTVSLSAVTADLIRLEVTASANQLSPGQTTTATVRLKDNGGNYVNVSGLSVTFSLTGTGSSSGTFGAVTDLGNGVYTVVYTATTPGTNNPITAALSQYYYVEQTASMTVRPLKIEILASGSSLNPNQSVNLTAKVRDYTGALISWGGHNLSFSYSGGTSTGRFSAVTDFGNGIYAATFTGTTAGTAVTFGATISTSSDIYATTSATVIPYQIEITSALTDVSVTRSTTVTARIKDWQGNYLTTGGHGVSFYINGTLGIVSLGTVTDLNNGSYTTTLSGVSLGSVIISASMTPSFTVTQTATINIKKLRLQITSSANNLMPGQTATITGRVKDWQGNQVSVGGQSFDFSATGGSSSGSFSSIVDHNNGSYTSTYTASAAGSAVTITGSITDSYQVDTTSTVTVQNWKLYVSIASSSLLVGQSTTITVTVKDYQGVQAATGGQNLFITQSGGTSSGTIGSVTDNNNGTYTASFSAISPGTALTISSSISQSYTVVQTANVTVSPIHLFLTVSQNSLNPSGSLLVSAQVRDSSGTNVLSGSYSIGFSYSSGTSTGTFGVTTNFGLGLYQTTFTGGAAGTAITISAYSSSSYVVDQTVSVTVVPWNIEITSSLSTLVINETATLTAKVKDWQGNYVTSGGKGLSLLLSSPGKANIGATVDNGNGTYTASIQALSVGSTGVLLTMLESYSISLSPTLTIEKAYVYVTVAGASSATISSGNSLVATATIKNSSGNVVNGTGYSVSFFVTGGTSTLTEISSVTEVTAGVYQLSYRGNVSGTATTISASMTNTYQSSATATVIVTPSSTISASNSSLTVSSTTLRSGVDVTLTATLKDGANNLVPGLTNVTFSKTTGSGIGTANLSSVTDNNDGTYTATLTGVTPGATAMLVSVTAGTGNILVSQTVNVTVTSGVASKLTVNGSTSLNANACSAAYYLSFYDSNDNSTTLSAATTFTLSGLGNAMIFSDSSCLSQITQIDVANNSSQSSNFYFKSFEAATYNLVFAATGITQTNTPFSITTNPVLSWLGSTGAMDLNGSGNYYGAGIWDGTFTTPYQISAVTLGGEKYLFVPDYTASSVQKIKVTDINSISIIGAIGRVHSNQKGIPTGGTNSSYCTGLSVSTGINGAFCTGGQYYSGTGNATFTNPYGTTVMSVSGTNYLFVSDYGNNRVVKYNADTGAYIGWTGLIGSTSGMSGACLSAGVGATTPGWCTGGTAIANASASTAVSGATTGGTSGGGNQFRNPQFITNDGVYIYFYDSGNNRVIKMDPTTGLVVHWMGRVSSVGAGGSDGTTSPVALTCLSNTQSDGTSVIVAGQFTPTWCSGGASVGTVLNQNAYTNTNLNPQFSGLRGMAFYSDGSYNFMLLSDASRVIRYFCGATTATPGCSVNSAESISSVNYYPGHYFGWTGYINNVSAAAGSTPASIASFFTYKSGSSISTPTNGWAYTGNSTTAQNTMGGMYNGYGITVNGTYAYVISYSDYRVNRLVLSGSTSGKFDAWIGRIYGTPSSGSTGCAGAVSGSVTPGWCYGGYATFGYSVGSFYSATSITNDGTYLYVSDITNNRVTIHNMSTGAAVGAIGLRVNNVVNGWQVASSFPNSYPNYPADTVANPSIVNRDGLFYLPDQVLIQGNYMYISDTGSNRIKRYNWLNGTFQGWVGMTQTYAPTGGDTGCSASLVGGYTPGWCTGGGFTSSSTFGFLNPRGLASDGTYLYIADQGNHRIVRINLSDGGFSGWIGYIGSQPSDGDAGCTSAAVGTATPGWCIGGTSASSASTYTLGGFTTPQGLHGFTDVDGKYYLIVGDSGNTRLQKIDVTTPTNVKWVGRNSSASTVCGATAGEMVMSWCSTSGIASTAANTVSYANNGYLGTVNGIYVDTSNSASSPSYYNMYVTSVTSATGRVLRFNATTGAFTGWVGMMGATTTNHGCSSTPTANTAVPSWCTGGTVTTGNGNGQMSLILAGVYTDGTSLYVSDTGSYRVLKYDLSSGVFSGWKGLVNSASGLGGGTNCSTTLSGSVTPTWCTGGTSKGGYTIDSSNFTSAFDTPRGITGKNGHLFIVDSLNGRILTMPK